MSCARDPELVEGRPRCSRSPSLPSAVAAQEPHRRQDPAAEGAHSRGAAEAAREARRARRGAGERRLDPEPSWTTPTATSPRCNGRLGEIQSRIVSTQKKLAWNQRQLAAAQRPRSAPSGRARTAASIDAYEHGDLGYVDVLLRARSFGDFVERWNDVRYLVKANEVDDPRAQGRREQGRWRSKPACSARRLSCAARGPAGSSGSRSTALAAQRAPTAGGRADAERRRRRSARSTNSTRDSPKPRPSSRR